MAYKKPRPTKHQFRVARSSAGLGLFAVTPIKRSDFVIEYYGKMLREEEADRKEGRGARYLFRINREKTIDGSPRYNMARYINHACKPNCYAERDGDRVFIYARRAIAPGEELSYSYGKAYFDEVIEPSGCRCSSCRSQ